MLRLLGIVILAAAVLRAAAFGIEFLCAARRTMALAPRGYERVIPEDVATKSG